MKYVPLASTVLLSLACGGARTGLEVDPPAETPPADVDAGRQVVVDSGTKPVAEASTALPSSCGAVEFAYGHGLVGNPSQREPMHLAATSAFRAAFYRERVDTSACITRVGACEVATCEREPSRASLESAGDLYPPGSGAPASQPDSNGLYWGWGYSEDCQTQDLGPCLRGPADFRATGTPGGIPPFVGSVPVPRQVTITAPSLNRATSDNPNPTPADPFEPPAFPRGASLEFTWTNGAGAEFVVVQMTRDPLPARVRITCTFPAAAGRGVVPAEALGHLPGASSIAPMGNLGAWSSNERTVHAGDCDIDLTASVAAILPRVPFPSALTESLSHELRIQELPVYFE